MPVDDQEKTEEATPKRREEARKKGQVARSQEIGSAALVLGGLLALTLMGETLVRRSVGALTQSWGSIGSSPLTDAGVHALAVDAMQMGLQLFLPIVGLMAVIGILASVVQHGGLWATDLLVPDIERISPIAGFKRIFSLRSLVMFLKTLIKFVLVASVTYYVVIGQMPTVVTSMQIDPRQALSVSGGVLGKLMLWTGVAIAFLGVVDYLFERWEYERSIRMSRQEMREEVKQTEGDPLLRARIRTIQREMARKRMISEVPKADVIVTNPTELAVAVLYLQGEMGAPKVVAKGAGFLAAKIREVAKEHNIPLVENKPVARALYRSVKVGRQIPSTLYRAVAEILAYVYRLKAKQAARPAMVGAIGSLQNTGIAPPVGMRPEDAGRSQGIALG